MLSFLVVFHLRSENSLCFSRFSPTCFSILDVQKYMKERIMRKERIYELGREIENLLYELKFETHDDFFIEIDKMIADHCFNIL